MIPLQILYVFLPDGVEKAFNIVDGSMYIDEHDDALIFVIVTNEGKKLRARYYLDFIAYVS